MAAGSALDLIGGFTATLGGRGAGGGSGGIASIVNTGAVQTAGADFVGLLSQSVGGGGGAGGVAGALATSQVASANFVFGGSGGDAGSGGTAAIFNTAE